MTTQTTRLQFPTRFNKLLVAVLGTIAMNVHAIEITQATATTGNQNTTYDVSPSTYQGGTQTFSIPDYIKEINALTWSPSMKVNSLMTVKIQVLLDRNHISVGTIDGGWGDASKQALSNFQRMKSLPVTGKMDQATWHALNANIPRNQPIIIPYTITQSDVNTQLAKLPNSIAERARANGLYFESMDEMLAEKFHMSAAYIRKLNPNATWKAGEVINVINTGANLNEPVSHIVVDRTNKTLFAYNNIGVIATYPVSVGSSSLTVPSGNYRIVNKVNNPWHKAVVTENGISKTYMLPPGPNNPLGVIWLGFDKTTYGIHGAPSPEGILLPTSMGAIRLINWDVIELANNIKDNVTVEVR